RSRRARSRIGPRSSRPTLRGSCASATPSSPACSSAVAGKCSTSGVNPVPTDAVYAATKFAVNGLTTTLRLEYLGKIPVSQILPGLVRTEFDEVRKRGDKAGAAGFYDGASGYLLPEDAARSIVFALSQPAHVNVAELLILPAS